MTEAGGPAQTCESIPLNGGFGHERQLCGSPGKNFQKVRKINLRRARRLLPARNGAARRVSLRRLDQLLVPFKLKSRPARHMSNHFRNYCVIVTACISLAGVESSPAQSDELPGDVMRGDWAAKAVDPATAATTSDVAPPRQHVRHLRAHKKSSADTPTDLTRPPDKPENAQNPDAKRTSVAAGGKVEADGAAPPNGAKVIAKPRNVKNLRPRQEVSGKARPVPSAGARPVRQRDFFSDIFGGDE